MKDGQARRLPPGSFFFSSRRRHTRWPRDWISDVCSSDLNGPRSARVLVIGWTCAMAAIAWTLEPRPDPALAAPSAGRGQAGLLAGPLKKRSPAARRSEEHTSELQSRGHLVCRLLLEKKK